jgi:phospholipid transport system transporter-binding protein
MNPILVEDVHTWRLSGELSFATVNALLAQFTRLSNQNSPQVVDLQDVTRTDSAGLALLIELLKQTKERPLTFRHIPPQLLSLAAVCGVQELLLTGAT